MTTKHTDVVILGSGLGSLTAATYLAMAGLRVVMLEEEALTKRSPFLREPFLLSSLGNRGCILRVLRELAIPLIEQRGIEHDELALQVLMQHARIDVRAGREALAREIEAYEVAEAKTVLSWFAPVDRIGDEIRTALMPEVKLNHGPAMVRRFVERSVRETPAEGLLPAIPESLRAFIDALVAPLSARPPGDPQTGSALLLRSTADGGHRMSGVGDPFLDLLRRRFLALHGEIRSVGEFSLLSSRSEVGVEFSRGSLQARALVIGAPLELVRRAIGEPAPRWLPASSLPTDLPQRLFRTDPESMPIGLDTRAVVATGSPDDLHWISRHLDRENPEIEWLIFSGPGVIHLDPKCPLGDLNPFQAGEISEIELGPGPDWDRDASDLRFPGPRPSASLRTRPPVQLVGAQVAPASGFEGEILGARQAAAKLLERLGTPKI
ncbi:MAG: hypothetical protein GY946_29455 [bacterium]|nr:hypothetical protein [bacterium]